MFTFTMNSVRHADELTRKGLLHFCRFAHQTKGAWGRVPAWDLHLGEGASRQITSTFIPAGSNGTLAQPPLALTALWSNCRVQLNLPQGTTRAQCFLEEEG